MVRITGAAAIAAILLGSFPDPAGAESLADAWAIALRVNQGLSAQQSQSISAGLSLEAARAARLPTVRTLNYNFLLTNSPALKSSSLLGPSSGATGSASSTLAVPPYFRFLGPNQNDLPVSFTLATLPLYTGGRLLRNIDAAGHQVQQQRTVEFMTALDLKLTVAEAYIAVLRARRSLEVAHSNVETLTGFARDTTNRRDQGLVIRSEELAAEVSLANAQLSAIRADRPRVGLVDLQPLPLPPALDHRRNRRVDQTPERRRLGRHGQAGHPFDLETATDSAPPRSST